MSRPRLIIFDLETTGVDPWQDRIVELFATDGKMNVHRYVNPTVPIPPEASKIHGIFDSHVAQVPTFRELAPGMADFFRDGILIGYNSRRYDTIMLHQEFVRAEIDPPFSLETVQEIDVLAVWRSVETQNLESAVKRWLGRRDFKGHRAKGDAEAAGKVLFAIQREYSLTEEECIQISAATPRQTCFIMQDGAWHFSFGMWRGSRVGSEDAHEEYLNWMLSDKSQFNPEVKRIARELLDAHFESA